ncbi:cytochrome b-c1 complex subunit 9 [Temnothorax curvispinosus]|uniref:Cytochrome b-c1 complex subunit 9 n=1 Tax=Temnothorax curvispinosus TaxID=300111 RepID=A0A6J1PFX6_9HYME|nr:cytochrome b-c1 complex subunit 9 [Temnothorax curvispinosus]
MLRTTARLFYRYVFKRSSTFTLGVVISAMFFERAYDQACDYIHETVNKGRLWKHIKHRYENSIMETRYTRRDQAKPSINNEENH